MFRILHYAFGSVYGDKGGPVYGDSGAPSIMTGEVRYADWSVLCSFI